MLLHSPCMDDDGKPKYTYSTKRLLGSGSFADVFLGSCCRAGSAAKKVAVKRIDKSKMKPEQLQALVRTEVKIMQLLRGHENIVQLLDCFQDSRYMHLVLEYCDGGDLAKHLERAAPLSESVIHDVLQQLSRAMQHARAHNIVHRDIKPQNIMLHKDPSRASGFRVLLTDFGFACRLATADLTQTFCGSPLHMAPELLAGGQYDPSIDLWSVGTIAYQMATGFTPYRASNLRDLKQKLRDAQQLRQALPLPPHMSPEFGALVCGLLEVDPKQRISFPCFFAHVFFQKQFVTSGASATESDSAFFSVGQDALSRLVSSSVAAADPASASFIIVDKRATEFAEKLDQLCAASDLTLSDDVRQIGLRDLADNVVHKSTLILQVAAGCEPLWEKLVLYSRALGGLRDAATRGREYMESLGTMRPCRQTIVAAQKFHNCMTHCLSEVDRVRREVYVLGEPSALERSRTSATELLYSAAMHYAQRGARHEGQKQPLAAETLYRSALALLLMVREECQAPGDIESLDHYVRITERRLHIVTTNTFSQIGTATMATDSHHLGIAALRISAMDGMRISKTDHGPPRVSSAPIDIPDSRARFCGSCGARFACLSENFCSTCGMQRTLMSISASPLSRKSKPSPVDQMKLANPPSPIDPLKPADSPN